MNIRDEAHEIFALAQLMPNEGIEDAVNRIVEKLETLVQQSLSGSDSKASTPKVCPKCGGKGKVLLNLPDFSTMECSICNGTGQTF